MSELSPARVELLKQVVDCQERMLDGASLVFKGLRQSSDPEVSSVSGVCFDAIQTHRAVLEALIDGLDATRH